MGFKSPWKKGTTVAVLIFVSAFILVVALFASKAKADTIFEGSVGATFVGGERYTSESFIYSEDFGKFRTGMVLQVRLECMEGSICKRGQDPKANQAIFVQRHVAYGNFEMNLGVSYWHKKSPAWNSNTPFMLGMKYYLNDFIISYTHFSTGGSSTNNGGLDMVNFGYRF